MLHKKRKLLETFLSSFCSILSRPGGGPGITILFLPVFAFCGLGYGHRMMYERIESATMHPPKCSSQTAQAVAEHSV